MLKLYRSLAIRLLGGFDAIPLAANTGATAHVISLGRRARKRVRHDGRLCAALLAEAATAIGLDGPACIMHSV